MESSHLRLTRHPPPSIPFLIRPSPSFDITLHLESKRCLVMETDQEGTRAGGGGERDPPAALLRSQWAMSPTPLQKDSLSPSFRYICLSFHSWCLSFVYLVIGLYHGGTSPLPLLSLFSAVSSLCACLSKKKSPSTASPALPACLQGGSFFLLLTRYVESRLQDVCVFVCVRCDVSAFLFQQPCRFWGLRDGLAASFARERRADLVNEEELVW